MKIMKLSTIVFLTVLTLGFGAREADAYRLIEHREWNLASDGRVNLSLRNKSGAIEVIGWDRDEIEIWATIRIRAASKNKAQKIYKKIDFEIAEEQENLSVKALVPRHQKDSMTGEGNTTIWVDYSIRVPYTTDVDIKASNGDIAVIQIEGVFRVVNTQGAIDVLSRGGEGLLKTGNGDIGCEIAFFPAGGKLLIKTGNGDLSLGIPEETSARLKARTGVGRVKLLLPMTGVEKDKRKVKKGILGGGDGEVILESGNGDITVGEL